MKKLLTVLFVLASFSLPAQTLFYYGQDSVSVKEFLRAYGKNNTGGQSEKALREYLDLYIASRLKIKEAREEGYDTLPQIVADLQNLRNQIAQAYINDRSSVDKMVDEAFTRSQKNVRIAHIFIRHTEDPSIADQKKAAVTAALKTMDFAELAKKYSDDPSAKKNGGDLGWITVFSLPYALENLAYSTPVGGHSPFYRSKAGYHLFRNLGERRDPGRMKASQILLAFPPGADEASKKQIKKLADSIYNRLLKGDDFGKLASEFSNDVVSAASKGLMQEFGAGQFDPEFETAVFTLKTDGAITKPFLTSYGYHIVKRESKKPFTNVRSETVLQSLREKVEQSDRINAIREALAIKVRNQAGFKQTEKGGSRDLYQFTDSIFAGKTTYSSPGLDLQTTVIQLGKDEYKAQDWISHVQVNRYKPDGFTIKSYQELWNEFIDAMTLKFYEAHLEDFNDEFRHQLTEFSEGNLFFEIMQRKVWGPAQSDSAALVRFYDQNRSSYFWKQSADAVIFYASEPSAAQSFISELKKKPSAWQSLLASNNSSIAADSSRVELSQIPNPTKLAIKPGVVTNALVNKTDNTASFALILRMYNKPEPRSYEEARGLVINDYQNQLEKEWVESLKKKYPVRINNKALEQLVKNKS